MKLNIEAITKKAELLNVPFHNMIAAAVAEQTIERLFSGAFSRTVCLRNAGGFNIEAYRKEAPLKIDLQYLVRNSVSSGIVAGKPIDEDVLEELSSSLFPRKDSDFLKWKVKFIGKSIYALGNMENYEIPLEVNFFESNEEDFLPVNEELKMTMESEKSIKVLTYPVEKRLADIYTLIFEKLELLGELSPYLDVVDITRNNFISGRKFAEFLAESCKKNNVALDYKRFEILKSYVNNKYMAKKWKSLLRVKKLQGPSWAEALYRTCFFIKPVWQVLSNDEVFFDDWMPELGKFM